ncbi:MAG TPA: GNAT family N-acetyltransferase [Terriglobales bacterium]|nr:GNAT family N-acetyltransferase [Terriglobales bacterium]
MRVRNAGEKDIPAAVGLAGSLGLAYPGMEGDRLWVAEDEKDGRVVGVVALKEHPDCHELCALGVAPSWRGRGVAKALVRALLAEAPGTVHLATVIPGFFEAIGFERAAGAPRTFIDRRKTSWCDGCDRTRCTVLLRKAS